MPDRFPDGKFGPKPGHGNFPEVPGSLLLTSGKFFSTGFEPTLEAGARRESKGGRFIGARLVGDAAV